VGGEDDLLEVVLARRTGGRFPDLSEARQEQADEDGDDGQDDQKLDQGEGATHGETSAGDVMRTRRPGVT
jgi:hypothetical protein